MGGVRYKESQGPRTKNPDFKEDQSTKANELRRLSTTPNPTKTTHKKSHHSSTKLEKNNREHIGGKNRRGLNEGLSGVEWLTPKDREE